MSRTKILSLFMILWVTPSQALPDDLCNRISHGDLSPVFLQQVKNLKPQLIRGYHLPMDFVNGYYARRIEPYLSKPNYSGPENPEFLYRGMYLTPEELQDILVNGMAVGKVTWTSAGGGVSFSSSSEEALAYIFQSPRDVPNKLGVVFKVRKTPEMVLINDPELNSTRTIFKQHTDVKPETTVDVYLYGRWGLESLKEIEAKAAAGKIIPHEEWTGVFNSGFSR